MNQSFLRAKLCLAGIVIFGIAAAAAQAPVADSPAIEAKAHEMLSKLTLEEKIQRNVANLTAFLAKVTG